MYFPSETFRIQNETLLDHITYIKLFLFCDMFNYFFLNINYLNFGLLKINLMKNYKSKIK